MGNGGVQAVELVFLLLLLFVIAFGALARRLQIPYPIVLVIAGGLLGLVPGIPRIALNPDTIFFVILPPLLYSAAWTTSWREFSCNIVNILVLGDWPGVFHGGRRSRSSEISVRGIRLESRIGSGRGDRSNRRDCRHFDC